MNQNPFSFYDFLGYLIPGGLFLYLLYFVGVTYELEPAMQIVKFINTQPNAFSLLGYASLIVSSYISGHFVSILSAFFIEKYMNESLNYPSIYLFENISDKYTEKRKIDKTKKIRNFIIKVITSPIMFLDLCTFKFCYSRGLPKKLAENLWKKVSESYEHNLGISLHKSKYLDGDLFRFAYHSAYEFSQTHQSKIQNYVALYGFCRNVCFIFLLNFWISVLALALTFFDNDTHKYNYLSIFITLFILYVFYCGFVKFYRRYSLEVLMAFSLIKLKSQ